MTLSEITQILIDAGIENAREEALLLVSVLFQKSRASLLADGGDYDSDALRDALDRRCEHYPLQYIIGQWYFYDEVYRVDENCLIPRADTELLVDYAIKNLPKNARFLDLCTGSGCIAVSTLAHRPDCEAIAVDIFPKTLALAKKNAEMNGVSPRFTPVLCDILGEVSPEIRQSAPFGAILSNPPYIRSAVVDTLEPELFFEPREALDGGGDGLVFYRAILEKYLPLLKENGIVLFEIGYDQSEDMEALAREHSLIFDIQKDMSGNPRLAILSRRYVK